MPACAQTLCPSPDREVGARLAGGHAERRKKHARDVGEALPIDDIDEEAAAPDPYGPALEPEGGDGSGDLGVGLADLAEALGIAYEFPMVEREGEARLDPPPPEAPPLPPPEAPPPAPPPPLRGVFVAVGKPLWKWSCQLGGSSGTKSPRSSKLYAGVGTRVGAR